MADAITSITRNVVVADPIYSTYAGPLDEKTTPVGAYDDLKSASRIPLAQRYIGLTVTVLNTATNNIPVEYWLVGGTKNSCWKIKTGNIVDTKASLLSLSPSACTIGLEMVVQADETNDNKVTKYWVTGISGGTVIWEQKQYGGGSASVEISGEDIEN